jgi:hypothetical protein
MAQYKCVPAPVGVVITKKNTIEDVAKQYEKIINQNATEGWEYHSQQDILVTAKAGCLASLTGKAEETTTYKLFVFKK